MSTVCSKNSKNYPQSFLSPRSGLATTKSIRSHSNRRKRDPKNSKLSVPVNESRAIEKILNRVYTFSATRGIQCDDFDTISEHEQAELNAEGPPESICVSDSAAAKARKQFASTSRLQQHNNEMYASGVAVSQNKTKKTAADS